jgi:hypothetical protein
MLHTVQAQAVKKVGMGCLPSLERLFYLFFFSIAFEKLFLFLP